MRWKRGLSGWGCWSCWSCWSGRGGRLLLFEMLGTLMLVAGLALAAAPGQLLVGDGLLSGSHRLLLLLLVLGGSGDGTSWHLGDRTATARLGRQILRLWNGRGAKRL